MTSSVVDDVIRRLRTRLIRPPGCHTYTSCSTTGPSQPLLLLRPSSVSAAVAIETIVRPVRPSLRTPSAEVVVNLLASSGTSNFVIFVVVVFYIATASSCRSSSTTTRHSTTSSTTSVLRHRLRPYPLYTSQVARSLSRDVRL